MKDDKNFRSGFITIIGRPNVGKSTFLNLILQEKLSIISAKPQTTRHQIKGIYNGDNCQLIFLDTPGFLKPRYELQDKMVGYIMSSLKDTDLIIFITDVQNYPTDYDLEILKLITRHPSPKIALLNKIDKTDAQTVSSRETELGGFGFERVIPISLINTGNLADLIQLISGYMPFNPPYYAEDEISDLPMRFFAQEIIREQIFHNFREEIPYSSTVVVEDFKEEPNKIVISANIWLERKSQKPILIGTNGEMIKKIRLASEKEIYRVIGKKIRLHLWIKIKPNWRKKKNALKEFGYQ
ncbi:MAG: GTPase Era [Candidatus Cloacimonetes bacterium]|nr:GTPase Era [Candidatus Cloacimonadota bacterium]